MTREEAIYELKNAAWLGTDHSRARTEEAVEMAIQTLSQEPTEKPMCDRNICISNEYNGIGCDECIVNKAEQEPCDDGNNLCNSCTNIGCEFQSGIVRTKCAFYMPPHIEPDNCGNYVVMQPPVTQKSGKWEEEPFINKPCISTGVCHEDKVKVLDKIRAEIYEHFMTIDGEVYDKSAIKCMEIIDKYK